MSTSSKDLHLPSLLPLPLAASNLRATAEHQPESCARTRTRDGSHIVRQAAVTLPACAKPPKLEKPPQKLTHTPRIAIVKRFREYSGRARRETKGTEGWRKAQAK
jgi:hypothetical protein